VFFVVINNKSCKELLDAAESIAEPGIHYEIKGRKVTFL
jgi:hypothetical protein